MRDNIQKLSKLTLTLAMGLIVCNTFANADSFARTIC